MIKRSLFIFLTGLLFATCGSTVGAEPRAPEAPDVMVQERQCMATGWQRVALNIAGLPRQLLWKGPDRPWTKGAIIIMHGGGGYHFQWCVANAPIVEPQVRFSNLALSQGFAVFLFNSSDQITDNEDRQCGKVWDDEVRKHPNLDLPFIGEVIRRIIPPLRSNGSRHEVFLTGLSSGGYMTTRASTHFDNLIAAFAPVSSGDPYGWHRICEKKLSPRITVHGIGLDNETGKQITERDSCRAESYVNERPWDSAGTEVKPAFRIFGHTDDGMHDISCAKKIGQLLRKNGYNEEPAFILEENGSRSFANHLWQDAYNRPILDFSLAISTRRNDANHLYAI